MVLQPTVTVSYLPSGNPQFCQLVVNLTGFVPGTYTVTVFHTSSFGVNPASPWTFPGVTTDATGAAQVMPFTYYQGFPENAELRAEANGVSSPFVNVSC